MPKDPKERGLGKNRGNLHPSPWRSEIKTCIVGRHAARGPTGVRDELLVGGHGHSAVVQRAVAEGVGGDVEVGGAVAQREGPAADVEARGLVNGIGPGTGSVTGLD